METRDFQVYRPFSFAEVEERLNGRVFNAPQPSEPVACFSCALPSCMALHAKLKKCGSCQVVSYCSVECQRAHWPDHKEFCKKTHAQMKKFHDQHNMEMPTNEQNEQNEQKSAEIQTWLNSMNGLRETLRTEAARVKAAGRLPILVVQRGLDHEVASVVEISENEEMVKKMIPENYLRPADPHLEESGMTICVIAVVHTEGVFTVRGRV